MSSAAPSMTSLAASQPECSRSARAAGVWGTLRGVVPRPWGSKGPAPPAAGGPSAAPTADRPSLERNSLTASSAPASGASTPKEQERAGAGPGAPDFGYSRGLEKKYEVLRELGRGGNGVVYVVRDRGTGAEYALKSIPKVLTDPKLSDA